MSIRLLSATAASVSLANGLAQECPASPDLMSILFQPIHRSVQKKGGAFVASASFADDGGLLGEVQLRISDYQAWCGLLRTKLNAAKTQICGAIRAPLAGGQGEIWRG